MIIRTATEADASELLRIYAPYVEGTPVTFECEVPTLEEFTGRLRDILSGYPYLAAEVDGRIVGYAYAHQHQERAAYQWNAELSVYLDGDFIGGGLGSALYGHLMDILRVQNIRNVYGCVTLPNPASERLHTKFGFRTVGVFERTGYKLGRWHDVIWYEKAIGDTELEPPLPVPFAELKPETVRSVL